MTVRSRALPDVVLVTVDALRADRVGAFGGAGGLTPALDRLAERSVLLTQAISAGSWTQASFPALLTSTYPSMHGGCGGALTASRPSPIERLAEHGYHTAAFSTNPWIGSTTGYHRGFAFFADVEPVGRDPWLRGLRGGQRLLRRELFHRLTGCRLAPAMPYASGDEVHQRLTSWLADAPSPFLLWVHYMDAHWPYHAGLERAGAAELAATCRDLAVFHAAHRRPEVVDPDLGSRWRALYDRAAATVDAAIGELVSALRRRGTEPLWMVVADHGEELGEHGRWSHHEDNLHDEILRVPWLVRLPDARRATLDDQVSTIDLMPTLLELCGCPAPGGMAGRSLAGVIEGGGGAGEAYGVAYCERARPDSYIVAVRTPGWKYVWRRERPDDEVLYDLEHDPAERVNVAAREPEKLAEGRARLAAHLERVRASGGDLGSPVTAPPTPALERRLRALGYLR